MSVREREGENKIEYLALGKERQERKLDKKQERKESGRERVFCQNSVSFFLV